MTVDKREIRKLLKRLPGGAKIRIELPTGENITVNKKPLTKQDIIRDNYAELIDVPITLSDAAEKYNVPRKNIANWVKRGYISIITPGYGMTVNEAEVAYCVNVYRQKKESGIGFRGPLLDKNGLPYKLKHPMLSRQRKKKKTGELPELPRAK